MREKLYSYLRGRAGAVPSAHLVRDVLGIHGASSQVAERLIAAAVAGDTRFEHTAAGWQVKGRDLRQVLFLVAVGARETSQLAFKIVHDLSLAGGGLVARERPQSLPKVTWQGRVPSCIGRRGTLAELLRAVQGGCVVEFRGATALRSLNSLSVRAGFGDLECDAFSLQGLARGLFGQKLSSAERLAAALGLPLRLDDPLSLSALLAEELIVLLERCLEKGLRTLDEVVELAEPPVPPGHWSSLRFGPEFLQSLPPAPGVYLMLSQLGEVLYVGKARNVRRRVRSYFQASRAEEAKTSLLRQHVHDIRIVEVGSELEALLLEHRLIAEHDPPVNRQLEVHARPVRAQTRANRILLLPSAVPGAVELFFASRRGAFAQMRAQPPLDGEEVLGLLNRLYFSPEPRTPGELEQQLAEILFSWLDRNRDSVSWVEVDESRHAQDCLRLLKLHVDNFTPGTRQIFR
ncbi:MAG: nucleotide excision repair endonuclease [Calditrichaeota bacterium]|nr:nucleotide excision repair endonuclease [Calditrichota bacterium]